MSSSSKKRHSKYANNIDLLSHIDHRNNSRFVGDRNSTARHRIDNHLSTKENKREHSCSSMNTRILLQLRRQKDKERSIREIKARCFSHYPSLTRIEATGFIVNISTIELLVDTTDRADSRKVSQSSRRSFLSFIVTTSDGGNRSTYSQQQFIKSISILIRLNREKQLRRQIDRDNKRHTSNVQQMLEIPRELTIN